MSNCTTCGKQLYVRNRSGYCATHSNASPEKRAKISQGVRRALIINPELREARRKGGLKSANMPGARERRSKACSERQLWKAGTAARTEETFTKIGRSTSERRMSWCPPELRDEARRLTQRQHMKLAEVKPIILAQHDSDMRRFRATVAPGFVDSADVTPDRPLPAIDPQLSISEKIIAVIAWHFGVETSDITGKSRASQHVRPRHAATYALRMIGMSAPKIGQALGGRDHSTIFSSLERAEQLISTDTKFAAAVEAADLFEEAA